VDLYDGPTMPRGALAKPFLRQLRGILEPGGLAVFNLLLVRRLAEYVRRLGQVFQVVRAVDVDFNVVVHCKPK
jgi:spermidine synthase